MNKKDAICRYLRAHHVGEENAVLSKELQRLFGLDGRELRRKIDRLRQEGRPICSGQTGYYYAASQKEINDTVYRLDRMVTMVSNARTGLLYAAVRPGRKLTVSFTIDLEEGT